DLPALPAARQGGVVLQPAQHEARLVGRQLAVEHRRELLAVVPLELVRIRHDLEVVGVFLLHHLVARSALVSSSINGLSSWSIASRARKMRERTVPTGQPIRWAISS